MCTVRTGMGPLRIGLVAMACHLMVGQGVVLAQESIGGQADRGEGDAPVAAVCPGILVSAQPASGVVDARQPHEAGKPLKQQGIGGVAEPIDITLSITGPVDPDCWILCETATGGDIANDIASVVHLGAGVYRVALLRPITPNAVTTISYGSMYVEFTAHPANVNADAVAGGADVLALINILNGQAVPPFGIYSTDVDHSGVATGADVLRVVDLLNGAAGFPVQLLSPLPANPGICPEPIDDCGDGSCDVPENCVNCPADCGTCSGDCCTSNGTIGCDALGCQDCVCTLDPFCCNTNWDSVCAAEAAVDCVEACPQCADCGSPGTGNCLEFGGNGSPYCEDEECCEQVCAGDPFCCDSEWDALCANDALANCSGAGGDCCVSNGTPGCETESCVDCVCTIDPFCCSSAWDFVCAGEAANECVNSCPQCTDCGSPGTGDCFQLGGNGTPFCENAACCETVCAVDAFCCSTNWDAFCSEEALAMCEGVGGDCCSGNGTPGCESVSCVSCVCDLDPFCCETAWDSTCAGEADDPSCAAVCPCSCGGDGTGDCFEIAGTSSPFCEDADCCESVCDIDAFCCETQWDAICALEALTMCEGAGGNCCASNGSPGCDSYSCVGCVCDIDPYCCETTWDAACAGEAQNECAGDCPC